MKIIADSREKKNAHLLSYFDRHGIEYEIRKLDVGDYMTEGGSVSIDTKRSIQEAASNLLNPKDHARFWREVRRARNSGIRLIVLIESNRYKAIKDLVDWKSRYSPVDGRALMEEMYRVHISYGVEFMFAPKVSTARKIIELLGGENDA